MYSHMQQSSRTSQSYIYLPCQGPGRRRRPGVARSTRSPHLHMHFCTTNAVTNHVDVWQKLQSSFEVLLSGGNVILGYRPRQLQRLCQHGAFQHGTAKGNNFILPAVEMLSPRARSDRFLQPCTPPRVSQPAPCTWHRDSFWAHPAPRRKDFTARTTRHLSSMDSI